MAEFQEVMRQKKRMCNSFPCCECDIYRLCGGGDDLLKCQRFISNNPKKAEEVIMSWAAEHPEPMYPTFREWLISIGVIGQMSTHSVIADNLAMTSIPADIAQKLGIEAK